MHAPSNLKLFAVFRKPRLAVNGQQFKQKSYVSREIRKKDWQ